MKMYVSVPHRDREDFKTFTAAIDKLVKAGHTIYDPYKDEPYPQPEDVDYHMEKFKESEKKLRAADIVIVEATNPGRRQGYEIARGLSERKFVIALFDKKKGTISTPPLLGNKSKYFLYEGYNDKNVDSLLEEGLTKAKDMIDTKFILIISPEIDRYLEWASTERRMHKAQIVRNSVEEVMEKDKDYQEYLSNLSA